ncbi:large ribosomal subunit protein bL19cz-like [Euphorbia lathyris]|uniref:large ribosomal subunit protein bL19cz-like n=1 Tax=Euphorbia lathyris TaxID=212925 RepID=UPI00331412BF
MQSFCRSLIRRETLTSSNITLSRAYLAGGNSHVLNSLRSDSSGSEEGPASKNHLFRSIASLSPAILTKFGPRSFHDGTSSGLSFSLRTTLVPSFPCRTMTTAGNPVESAVKVPSEPEIDVAPRIKFKRLDKTARHIMQILDKEAVEDVKTQKEIPDIRPGYIVQLKVEVPENKRRVSIVKGIVIARRNAGLNTTFRLRRLVAGVGVESLYLLYSPNIKEIKVLDKKKVRRAKLYYLRDKMNALKKQ